MTSCEEYKQLLMGLLDDELTSDERIVIHDHMTRCASCRDDYEQLLEAEEHLKAISLMEPEDKVLDKIWRSPYNKFTRNAGLFSVLLGWIVLIVYALYQLLIDSHTQPLPKIATLSIFVGFFILLILVIVERWKTYKVDPYREVER